MDNSDQGESGVERGGQLPGKDAEFFRRYGALEAELRTRAFRGLTVFARLILSDVWNRLNIDGCELALFEVLYQLLARRGTVGACYGLSVGTDCVVLEEEHSARFAARKDNPFGEMMVILGNCVRAPSFLLEDMEIIEE